MTNKLGPLPKGATGRRLILNAAGDAVASRVFYAKPSPAPKTARKPKRGKPIKSYKGHVVGYRKPRPDQVAKGKAAARKARAAARAAGKRAIAAADAVRKAGGLPPFTRLGGAPIQNVEPGTLGTPLVGDWRTFGLLNGTDSLQLANREELKRPPKPLEVRRALSLTSEMFARLLGVSDRTLTRWEQGDAQPGPHHLQLLGMLREAGELQPTGIDGAIREYGGIYALWQLQAMLFDARRRSRGIK